MAKDGRILDVWLTVTKLLDDTGKPVGIASTERDITERKRAEEDLNKKMRELEDFHKLTIDRELKMLELKKEIEELKARLKEK